MKHTLRNLTDRTRRGAFAGTRGVVSAVLACLVFPGLGYSAAAPEQLRVERLPGGAKQARQLVESVDAGDYYLIPEGKRTLYRWSGRVLVQGQGGKTAAETADLLTAAGRPLAGHTRQPFGKGAVILSEPEAGRDAALRTAASAIDSLRAVRGTAEGLRVDPVFIDPESGLLMTVGDEIILCLVRGTDAKAYFGAEWPRVRPLPGTKDQFVLTLDAPTAESVLEECVKRAADARVAWAEPNFKSEAVKHFTPNDPLFNQQWQLKGTGTGSVRAEQAWNIAQGADTVIAVIDDGVQTGHPDLASNIFVNTGEIAGNGIDDDGNGFVDDVNGWDVVDETASVIPSDAEDNHGSAVAGVAAAVGNNAAGVMGASFRSKILPVKMATGDDRATYSQIATAFRYAAGLTGVGWRGADAINFSWSCSSSAALNSALTDAATLGRGGKGCPIFAASGNDADGGMWSVPIVAGTYPIRFEYKKDGSVSLGMDAVWLDDVTLPGGGTESFEGASFPPSDWATGGNADWTKSTVAYGTGTYSARSGAIGNNQSSWVQVTKTVTAGNMTFRLIRDCEYYYDRVNIYTNGVYIGYIAGDYLDFPISYPASHASVVAVGASNVSDYKANYSQFGAGLDFVAPGGDDAAGIYTTDRTGTAGYNTNTTANGGDYYDAFNGTSSASPLAAGVGALVLSANPELTAGDVRSIMRRTCVKVGDVGYSGGDAGAGGTNTFYGYGRVNAYEAVRLARGTALTLAQNGGGTTVTEGGASDNYTLALAAQPPSTVTVTLDPGSQLAVSPSSVTFTTGNWNTPQTVTVTAVNDTLFEGTHTGTVVHAVSCAGATFSGPVLQVGITDNDSAELAVGAPSGIIAATGGSATFAVSGNVSWAVAESADWLIVSPAAGATNATVTATATANDSTGSRSATVTVTGGGITCMVTVTQAGAAPSLTVGASTVYISQNGGQASFAVSGNVQWTASDNASWLTVSPTTSTTNATVTAQATSANTAAAPRTAMVTVSGGGITHTVTVIQSGTGPVIYVNAARSSDSGNGLSWSAAKKTVQAAVDIARDGDTVLVTNGVYTLGGAVTPGGSLFNRVVITNNIIVRSVNGADVTVIQGSGTNAYGTASAMRCVYISQGLLRGFTLSDGSTKSSSGVNGNGGGAYADGGTIENCIISGNKAYYGGGSYYGSINHCTIVSNTAAYNGGGTYYGVINNSRISDNRATSSGGGAYYGTLKNCLISANQSGSSGGGVYYSSLYNSTIVGNTATSGGGVYSYTPIYNCIVWANRLNNGTTNDLYTASYAYYTCASGVSGSNNTNANPRFVNEAGGDYRLQSGSPCIDKGCGYADIVDTSDLDGNGRVADGDGNGTATVDMGAYEYGALACASAPRFTPLGGTSFTNSLAVEIASDTPGAEIRYTMSTGTPSSPTASSPLYTGPIPITAQGTTTIKAKAFKSGMAASAMATAQYTCEAVKTPVISRVTGTGSSFTNALQLVITCGTPGSEIRYTTNGTTPTASSLLYTAPFTIYATATVSAKAFKSGMTDSASTSATYYLKYVLTVNDGTGSGEKDADSTCTVSANIPSGQVLAGWTVSPFGVNLGAAFNNRETLTALVMPAAHITLTPVYRAPATIYVNASRSNDSGNGLSWSTAKKTLQAAINAAGDGNGAAADTVLATNGVYNLNGASASGSNRVVIAKNLTLRSVNGAEVTVIQGAGTNAYGTASAMRCAYLSKGILRGFTLRDGATTSSGYGGGAYASGGTVEYCVIANNRGYYCGGVYYGIINNCQITNNAASYFGGGTYYGTLKNCLIASNRVLQYGGGTCASTLYNCTIIDNVAGSDGGGTQYGSLYNCIVWANRYTSGVTNDCYSSSLYYTCASGVSGSNNTNANPRFVNEAGGDFRLHADSPCIDKGSNSYVTDNPLDLDSNVRVADGDGDGTATTDMGAYEYGALLFTETPVFSPGDGTVFEDTLSVFITCGTAGVVIRYTLDGSEPTVASPVCTGSLTLSSSATVKAKAFKDGHTPSAIATATFTRIVLLQNGVPVSGLADAVAKHFTHYKITVPSGATSLVITTSGGTGDADLYVKRGTQPTTSSYDYRPYIGGNAETVTVSNPASGDWHIALYAYSVYSGVTLTATYTIPTASATSRGTPYTWLEQYGLVGGGYEAADGADADGDGLAAWQEYVAGTVPTNAASVFTAALRTADGSMRLHWTPDLTNASPVRTYQVWGTHDLLLGFPALPLTNVPAGMPLPLEALGTNRFFKVGVEIQ